MSASSFAQRAANLCLPAPLQKILAKLCLQAPLHKELQILRRHQLIFVSGKHLTKAAMM